jgi:hypothetical protein
LKGAPMRPHPKRPPINLRRAVALATPLAALALSCSVPSHAERGEGGPETWGDDGETSVTAATAVTCPAYDPQKFADGPADEPAPPEYGGLSGSFQVGADGAATYTVPLDVVPGRAGLQPSLALSYNSNAGNGVVGVGFSLAGSSAIARCPMNEFDDGKVQGVKVNREDRFCLDGLRLVAVSGEYGADGTEYRTVPDTFVRVRSFGGNNGAGSPYTGPERFTVWAKNGRIHEYGALPTTRVLFGLAARQWSVSSTRDRAGNELTYTYANAEASVELSPFVTETYVAEHLLASIQYSSDGPGSTPRRAIYFLYDDTRPDPVVYFAHGAVERHRN